ncbi:MAG: CcmD family protein [Bacteroidetes bacterium]|nr:CcmD family protein [Bacteroidota bacterium]
MNRMLLFLIALMSTTSFFAQAASEPQMADAIRENGKIYVVIAVLAIIFVSIIGFLIYLERKIKNLNDKIDKKS